MTATARMRRLRTTSGTRACDICERRPQDGGWWLRTRRHWYTDQWVCADCADNLALLYDREPTR